jgi:hypothetical protein
MVAPNSQETAPVSSPTAAPVKRGRGRPRKLPVEPIAQQIAHAVIAGKDIPGTHDHAYLTANGGTRLERAIVAKILGPDVEAFRLALADKMLAVADEMTNAIHRDIDEMPPASRAFALCALTDKAEQLRAKLATSPRSAQVNVQINQFGPGTVDRSAILAALAGNIPATPQPEPIAVEPTPAEPAPEPGSSDSPI